MDKNGILTISDWQNGMADSAYQGFSNISNAEVFDTPGVLKVANKTTSKISISLTGMPIAYVEDKYGNNYYLTSDGKLYKNETVITTGLTNPWDLIIYNDYLLVTSSTLLSCYGPISNAPSWLGTISSGFEGYYGKMTAFKNSSIYITNGQYIAWLSALPTALPTVAPTPTINKTLITLPDGEAGTTIAQLGTYMVVGTQEKNGSWANATNGSIANLYLFDGVGVDGSVNSLIGSLNESSVQAMISQGNRLYVQAGTRGNVYMSDTSSFTKIKRIPWNQDKLFSATMRTYPNAMAINSQGNILVGTSTLTDSYNSTDLSTINHGVYEIAIAKNYPTVLKNTISTGNLGRTSPLKIGFIYTKGDYVNIGWQDGSSYGLDWNAVSPFYLYTSANVDTQLFYVGSRLNRKSFQNLEFLLGRPLKTGQSISISYRKNLSESFTSIGTFTYSSLGGVISHNTKALVDDAELLQFRIGITLPASTISADNLELVKITLW